ncbi:MucB/RseB C-terminal domain-containing protein [Robbsia sp. KACC 23696]|uniref:MucB/RseB C-terminal domain-containing protein n=1 Tax=Robbsia sp. KACC 23696 TaxID=3149231 RepID=UPI00325BEE82
MRRAGRRAARGVISAGALPLAWALVAALWSVGANATPAPVTPAPSSGATRAAMVPASASTTTTGNTAAAPTMARAAALLAGLNAAAEHRPYEGTFVFQRGASVRSSRIVHMADGQGQFQRIDSLDGEARWVIEHDDDLYTYLPASKTVIVDRRRKGQDNFPAMLSADSALVLQHYMLALDGSDRVAGVDCVVLTLAPRDAYRFTYRLSVDPATGLLIKAQTLDAQGQVLEQVAFSQIRQAGPDKATVQSLHTAVIDMKRGDAGVGWKIVRAPSADVDLAKAGWSLDPGVVGFRKMLELRRPMAARQAGAPPVPVDQAVFSDGVTAVSLFIEPVGTSDRKQGQGQSGATHLLAERHGDFWVTLIGEVPAETLRRFADAIQFTPGAATRSDATKGGAA